MNTPSSAIRFSLVIVLFFIISGRNAVKSASLCHPDSSYQHLIITSESFKNDMDTYSLRAFCDFRTNGGLKSVIVSIENIDTAYTGRDKQERIRNFIRDAANTWGVKYVLLGGDNNIIPARILRARNKDVASDLYYGCLDGNFNANNNAYWGEQDDELDFEYNVFVGRASAESLTEIRNFVYKTITYETSPLNASYHTKMLQYNANDKGIGNTTRWNVDYRSLSKELSAEYHYLTPAQSDAVINPRLNSKNIGYYLGASHGLVNSLGNISKAEADAFSNGDQFFFVASIACLSGKFIDDCVAEHLTTSTRTGGAFAGFFNSHDAYPPYITQYLFTMRDSLFQRKVTRLGNLRACAGKRYSVSQYNTDDFCRYQAYEFNLFGDPATEWKITESKPIDLIIDFEHVSSSVVNDISTNNMHAEIHGNPTQVPSIYGQSMEFNGERDYLQVKHSDWNPIGAQTELTLAVRVCALKMRNDAGLLVKGNTKQAFALTLTENGHIAFSINKNNPINASGTGTWISNTRLAANAWHHVAITLNYVETSIKIYIDGVLDKTATLPSGWLIGLTNEPLYIGMNPSDDSTCFNGLLDDVQIYSRSYSASEISGLSGTKTSTIKSTSLISTVTNDEISGYTNSNHVIDVSYANVSDSNFCLAATLQHTENETFKGCVKFVLDNNELIDTLSPYSTNCINKPELNEKLQAIGKHTLTIYIYDNKLAEGIAIDSKTIELNVTKNGVDSKPVALHENIIVFPNPAENHLTIKCLDNSYDNYHIELLDNMGKLVLEANAHNMSHYLIDLTDQPKGIYFLRLYNTNIEYLEKILKQ